MTALLLVCWAVASLAAHEAGHAAAARMLGFPVRFGVGWLGPYVRWGSDARVATGRERFLVAAWGPMVNLLILAVALDAGLPLLAVVQADVLLVGSLRDYRSAWRAARTWTGTPA